MPSSTPIVTIFGGSGFIGRYIAQKMARAGWRVRVAVRRPNEAMYVKPYGDVGQVEPILCNVRDENSTRAAMVGADAVVNCVGILQETKFQSFEDVHIDSASLIARLAVEEGISKLVHLSALGASDKSASAYAETKAEGDAQVLEIMPAAVVLRPSVVFGREDRFFNRIAEFGRFSPIVPVICGATKFQPVYVNDVADAAVLALTSKVAGGVYELGGPEVATLQDLTVLALNAAGRNRTTINAPMWIARTKAWAFETFERLTGGLFPAMFTRDQILLLESDSVVAESANGFEEFGIKPTAMESVLEDYLCCYRSSGQFTAMSDSATNTGQLS